MLLENAGQNDLHVHDFMKHVCKPGCIPTAPSEVALVVKNSPARAGEDTGPIPGSGRSPGGGHGHPPQCSCLENATGRGAWRAAVRGVAASRTRLKRLSPQYVADTVAVSQHPAVAS